MLGRIITILLSFIYLENPPAEIRHKGRLEIRFNHVAGTATLYADSLYKNAFGEPYRISRFKYYVTNIRLVNSNDNSEIPLEDSYFLVQDGDELSKSISMAAPEGRYKAVSFLLGVDSLHNVSGAQTGALDPMNGMFWTWNTGYVSVKLEGKSPLSPLPGNLIEYHLGGFKGPDQVNRRISLPFPAGNLELSAKKSMIVTVKVDVNSFFSGSNELPIKANPACTSAGSLARRYSENYATSFSISGAGIE